jgi:hypothetical protein
MTLRPGKLLSRAIFAAATRPLGLSIAGTGAIAAVVLHSGVLGGVAAGGYVISIAVAFARRRFWRAVADGLRREPPALPFEEGFTSPAARGFATRLANARHARGEAWRRLPASSPLRARVPEERAVDLEERAVCLLDILERLSRQLTSDGREALRGQIQRLAQVVEAVPPDARVEYDRARSTLEGSLRSLEALQVQRHLVTARLEAMICALEALPVHLFHIPLAEETRRVLHDDLALTRLGENLAIAQTEAEGSEPGALTSPSQQVGVQGPAASAMLNAWACDETRLA